MMAITTSNSMRVKAVARDLAGTPADVALHTRRLAETAFVKLPSDMRRCSKSQTMQSKVKPELNIGRLDLPLDETSQPCNPPLRATGNCLAPLKTDGYPRLLKRTAFLRLIGVV
jgi:hypothetical protein